MDREPTNTLHGPRNVWHPLRLWVLYCVFGFSELLDGFVRDLLRECDGRGKYVQVSFGGGFPGFCEDKFVAFIFSPFAVIGD